MPPPNAAASMGLNEAQHDAVSTLSGPLLVLAGAGTGKTRVITYRIANLVRHGTPAHKILAVTFTNKAAREMRERVQKLLNLPREEGPLISTFHALCANVLRQEITHLGYPLKFGICDRGDQESIARTALREARIDPKSYKPGELLNQISRWKMQSMRALTAARNVTSDIEAKAARAYLHYEKSLKAAGSLDFDDLLLCAEELFDKFPDVLQRQQARFRTILVDEYQDTNASQYRILVALAKAHNNLCVVGDDDQSIYGWRGAEVQNILGFDRDFEGAKVIRLEENYRCCPSILKLANQLIACNTQRFPKVLRASRCTIDEPRFAKYEDETEEAESVVRDIAATVAKEKNRRFKDFAILFRTNEQPRLFETELRARAIPYKLVGGYSFFDRREIRDVLAYLRVLANPADEVSLLRILNVPPRGIGPSVIERLVDRAVSAGKPLCDVIPTALADNVLPPRSQHGLSRLMSVLDHYRTRMEHGSIVDELRSMLDSVEYRSEIARLYEASTDQTARWDAVGELLNMVAQYQRRESKPTLTGFLQQVALEDKDDDRKDPDDKDAVTLMTLHSAKGLEFPIVYLVGLEEGILPHERSIDSVTGVAEERRLAYVGITRAKDRLILTRAQWRTRFGSKQWVLASRFLPEMFGKTNGEAADAGAGSTPRPAATRGRPGTSGPASRGGSSSGNRPGFRGQKFRR